MPATVPPDAALDFTPLVEVRSALGESPVYDARRDALWWADISGCALHRVDLGSGAHLAHRFDSEVCSLGVAVSGRLVVALRKTVGLFDPDSGRFAALAEIEGDRPHTRLNDGKVGPDGAFYVGSMDERPERPAVGVLYRVDGAGRVEPRVTELRTSNGLAFSPDGRRMFHSDSRAGWIDQWHFDPATGAMSGRARFATLTDEQGRPDGGTCDAKGGYWSAGLSARRLNRFAPGGRLVASYAMPAAATMPCFGGRDFRRLFVTSMAVEPGEEALRYPLSGATLAAASPVTGAPVSLFRDL